MYIPNTNKMYSCDIEGNLYSHRFNKTIKLKLSLHNKGYLLCNIYYETGKKLTRVHRVIATCFITNTENKPDVNHKNGIKNDNRADNLEWCDYIENNEHYHKILKQKKQTCNFKNLLI